MRDLDLARPQAGAVMTTYALAYAFTSPVLIALTGRLDRRDAMLIGLGLFTLGGIVSAFAGNYAILLASRVLAALGAAIYTPVASSAAVGLVAPDKRAWALGIVFGGLTLAQVTGVPIGGYLGYTFGWRSAFWAVGALGIAAIPLMILVPRAIPAPPSSLSALATVLRSPRLMTGVAFTALFMAAAYVVYTFIGPMMESRFNLGGSGVTTFLAVFGAGAVLGNALGAALTTRLGSDRTLILLCVGQMILMPVLTLAPVSFLFALGLTLAWSISAWSFMVPQQARLVSLAPPYQGLLLALNASAIYVGVSLGATLGGFVVGDGGYPWLGPVGAAVALLALFTLRLVRQGEAVEQKP